MMGPATGYCGQSEREALHYAQVEYQPVQLREYKMLRFKSPESAQRFLATHAVVHNTFNIQRHCTSHISLRLFPGEAFLHGGGGLSPSQGF
jgi:putative transposase